MLVDVVHICDFLEQSALCSSQGGTTASQYYPTEFIDLKNKTS